MSNDGHITPPALPQPGEAIKHASLGAAHFVRTAAAVAAFTTSLLLRGRRVRVMMAIILIPVGLPLLLAYLAPADVDIEGHFVFTIMMEFLYAPTLVPLGAIFFASSLLGDEVENKTFPLLLSRPLPRSALVFGKYFAYVTVCVTLFLASAVLAFASCVVALKMPLSYEYAADLFSYCIILAAGVLAYGAFCLWASTISKRPVILAIIFVFGWEKFSLVIPGSPRLFTIQAYLNALLPDSLYARWYEDRPVILDVLARTVPDIGTVRAVVTLTLTIIVMLVLASYIVRNKEYAASSEGV